MRPPSAAQEPRWASQPALQRKVRQLDNDVNEIYLMLNQIQVTQSRHGVRLDELDSKLTAHDARFDAVDAKLLAHDERFDRVEARLDGIDGKIETVLTLLRER